jgi:hypothetical protein
MIVYLITIVVTCLAMSVLTMFHAGNACAVGLTCGEPANGPPCQPNGASVKTNAVGAAD